MEVIGEEFIKEGRSCGPDVTYADFVKEGADDTAIALFCRYHCRLRQGGEYVADEATVFAYFSAMDKKKNMDKKKERSYVLTTMDKKKEPSYDLTTL